MTTTESGLATEQSEQASAAPAVLTLDDIRSRATLDIEEAAALLGISRLSAYRQARSGESFPVKRIGRRLLVPVPALIAWLGEG
ncbi:helix-turn-helix domain-containing protein [Microbacterium sp.]|uniref:helix-turn-helix domain-containing protein n=1 Tax=Microbacterium sp. TaxID=51671 RepID=UPI0039E3454B